MLEINFFFLMYLLVALWQDPLPYTSEILGPSTCLCSSDSFWCTVEININVLRRFVDTKTQASM